MAQASKFTLTTSSESVGIPENVAAKVFHLAPWDTKLLTAIGDESLPEPCTNPTYKYQDIQERPTRSTLNGAIDNSITTVIITDAIFAAGETIQCDEETVLLGTTSDNLTFSTCTRSVGAGTAAAHLTLAPVLSYGKPRVQGAAASTTGDLMIQQNQITTYTQIFSKAIAVADTSNVLDRYGREGTEYQSQAIRQMKTLKKELENAFIWSHAVAPVLNSTAGQMDGIYERLATNSTTDLSDAALSQSGIEAVIESISDWGGMANLICPGLYAKRAINSWGVPYIQHVTDPMDSVNMTFGASVTRLYLGDVEMLVLPMDILHAHCMVLSTNKLGIGSLSGRSFAHTLLAKDGDRTFGQVVGEYTGAIPCDRGHHIFTSVKFA